MHPHGIHCSFHTCRLSIPNCILIGTVVFAQLTAESSYTLQWAAILPSKLPLRVRIWTPCNTVFLRLTRVHIPNSISIGSVAFCRAHDRDRRWSIALLNDLICSYRAMTTAIGLSVEPVLSSFLKRSFNVLFFHFLSFLYHFQAFQPLSSRNVLSNTCLLLWKALCLTTRDAIYDVMDFFIFTLNYLTMVNKFNIS